MPWSRMSCRVRSTCLDASQWNVMMPRSLFAKAGTGTAVNGLDHQMHVHGTLRWTNCLEHERANGQIRT